MHERERVLSMASQLNSKQPNDRYSLGMQSEFVQSCVQSLFLLLIFVNTKKKTCKTYLLEPDYSYPYPRVHIPNLVKTFTSFP